MPQIIPYNRLKAVNYAEKWALSRNPRFFNYDTLGGDCTNFVSQVILAGDSVMNYRKNFGWFYINSNSKSPSWTGVNFLYNFLTTNKSLGPFAIEVGIDEIQSGDIVQLNFQNDPLYDHTLIMSIIKEPRSISNILVCSHTIDRLNSPLSSIKFEKYRFLHILGNYK